MQNDSYIMTNSLSEPEGFDFSEACLVFLRFFVGFFRFFRFGGLFVFLFELSFGFPANVGDDAEDDGENGGLKHIVAKGVGEVAMGDDFCPKEVEERPDNHGGDKSGESHSKS